ncbi:MAG TPA: CDP-diacylglycerol--glycerol-3-phosphate 3-phosphatidyltransferase [Burkholderiales bacterium]|jgi:CDP-diacylglycerol--glycerol-3-phosphate 3-phosphatidyltransferase
MIWTTPNLLTLLRLVLIPLFIAVYYLPIDLAHEMATGIFVIAAATDWLDGYLARRLHQYSPFGAFLDPVVDKLIVVAALVLLVGDPKVAAGVLDPRLFAIVVLVIVGREIAVSALREWMAGSGKRSRVAVSFVGKFKTTAQMVAIPFLLWREPIMGLPTLRTGEVLLYIAAGLTLWSMLIYLRLAWVDLVRPAAKKRPRRGG